MSHPQNQLVIVMPLLLLSVTSGCDRNDVRLAEYAKNSVVQQTRQNEQISRQSSEVTQQGTRVTEAAKELVIADSQARREMISGHQELQDRIQTERASLDQQRLALDEQQRQVVAQQNRDSLLAAALSATAALLICALPLFLCWRVLHGLQHQQTDEAALNEILLLELAGDRPVLLPPRALTAPRLVQEPSPDLPGDETTGVQN